MENTNFILAFAKEGDSDTFKRILARRGVMVQECCSSGARALSAMEDLERGIIICGYRLNDMVWSELADYLSPDFQMLVIASPARMGECGLPEGVLFLPTPVTASTFLSTLDMMVSSLIQKEKEKKKKKKEQTAKSPKEQKLIDEAKALLMERHQFSEKEAHKYLQKYSMDTGRTISETASMIISLYAGI
ncbi:ANTAR domain-containing response regulator [Butyrivibrio sp. MC2013]|uniref:ANTAR domain-containing response regulator n=1 Tax=Butyrivibrio sp. MC2013 TaxID=1280686 RepID=UPI000427651C|nr:ANTAR domain-containing protein [Butyrivibrio sp. MC2013]